MKRRDERIAAYQKALKKFAKQSIGGTISINDLRDKEDRGKLSVKEHKALRNYERYRLKKLNAATSEDDFHKRYQLLQVLANLSPYEEFLDEKYEV